MGMLNYIQSSGNLYRDGRLIGLGYAGNGVGLNNPDKEDTVKVGPLPAGKYTLELVTNIHLGPRVFHLVPDPSNKMYGRSEFYIHWDNQGHNFSASEGCIVLVTTWTFQGLADGDRLIVKDQN